MNIRTVLCPIDFSQLANQELELAVQVCETFQARLVLHHNLAAVSPAFSTGWQWDQSHNKDERSEVEAERRLAELVRQLPRTIQPEATITHGPLAPVVLALAAQLPADLLVLGTHGWSTEDHASVTENILERTPCPVLTIRDAEALRGFRLRPGPEQEPVRVVVPTDFSRSATRAVAYAVELARQLPLELHLLHVSPAPAGDHALETMANSVPPDLKQRAQYHLRVGRPLEEIEAGLRQLAPGLVVMGTHARDFWRRFFTRDMARRILHDASCPVCFVPASMTI